MKKLSLYSSLLMAAALAACSSMPTNSTLEQARMDYQAAQANPNVQTLAPAELREAGTALAVANSAAAEHENNDRIEKLAYIAKQKIGVSQEVAKQRAAERAVASAGKIRDEMRLDARTAEADRAKADADRAKAAADRARMDAEAAQAQARVAQGDAMDSQRRAEESQRMTAEAQARARALEAQLADLSAKQTERGLVMTLGDVLFATDQATLTANGVMTVQKLAAFMKAYPERTVMVEGFTDSTGTAAHNQELSERRAMAVRSALLEQGVDANRIGNRGFGQSFPVAANDNASNRQLNRRVEIVISDDHGMIRPRSVALN